MKNDDSFSEFLEACISSGKYIEDLDKRNSDPQTIGKIEDILMKCNDVKARLKITKLYDNNK